MRTVSSGNDTLHLVCLRQWLISDNLGSTSVTANADGSWKNEICYSAFGEA